MQKETAIPNPATLEVQFTGHDIGFIDFAVRYGNQVVEASASETWDPFPALMAWLESLALGVHECAFLLDPEGPPEICFRATPFGGWGNVKFTLSEYEAEPRLSVALPRIELVEAFYRAVVDFSESELYHPKQWEAQRLGSAIEQKLGMPPEAWIEQVVTLSRREVQKRIWVIYPECTLPDTSRSPEDLGTLEERAEMELIDSEDNFIPAYWPLHKDWDNLTMDRRRDDLLNYMSCNFGPYRGMPLRLFRSPLIEDWLAGRPLSGVASRSGW